MGTVKREQDQGAAPSLGTVVCEQENVKAEPGHRHPAQGEDRKNDEDQENQRRPRGPRFVSGPGCHRRDDQVHAGKAGKQHNHIEIEAQDSARPTIKIQGQNSSPHKAVGEAENVKAGKELIARQ